METKIPSPAEKIFDQMLEDIADGDLDLSREMLLSAGYNMHNHAQQINRMFRQQYFQLTSAINRQKNEALLEKAGKLLYRKLENIDRPIAYLKELFNNNAMAVQYNNLEKLDEEAIRAIIKDMNHLKLIEELENGKKQ